MTFGVFSGFQLTHLSLDVGAPEALKSLGSTHLRGLQVLCLKFTLELSRELAISFGEALSRMQNPHELRLDLTQLRNATKWHTPIDIVLASLRVLEFRLMAFRDIPLAITAPELRTIAAEGIDGGHEHVLKTLWAICLTSRNLTAIEVTERIEVEFDGKGHHATIARTWQHFAFCGFASFVLALRRFGRF